MTGLDEGRRLRDEGTDAAGLAADWIAVSMWKASASLWLDSRRRYHPFTSDDLVEAIGMPPVPAMLGATFLHWRRSGRTMPVGYAPSTRPSAHARPIRVWRIKE